MTLIFAAEVSFLKHDGIIEFDESSHLIIGALPDTDKIIDTSMIELEILNMNEKDKTTIKDGYNHAFLVGIYDSWIDQTDDGDETGCMIEITQSHFELTMKLEDYIKDCIEKKDDLLKTIQKLTNRGDIE